MPDSSWDAAFFATDGWAGGDAAYSVDLHDGRVLWLFADTWIGKVAQGRRLPGTKMVNNTIAVHPKPADGRAPDPASVRFFWGPAGADGPASWIVPPPPPPPGEGDKRWYWPADGIIVRGADGRDRLIVFLWTMGRRDGKGGAFDFKNFGGALAVIDNPHDSPDQWRVTQHPIPHTQPGALWGMELIADPKPDGREDLYVFGIRGGGWTGAQLLLARVAGGRVEDGAAWGFRTAGSWSSKPDDAVALASGMVSEFSISELSPSGERVWVMVQSQPLMGNQVLVRTAKTMLGPWSKPKPVWTVELDGKKAQFTYAAKAHPELSRPGELLVTYVINSHSFWNVLADASIYRPRFVRAPLSAMPAPP